MLPLEASDFIQRSQAQPFLNRVKLATDLRAFAHHGLALVPHVIVPTESRAGADPRFSLGGILDTLSSQGHQGSQNMSSIDLRQEGPHPHLYPLCKMCVTSSVL